MTPSPQHLEVAKIYLETKIGIKLPLSVLIVPTIPSPLQNAVQSQLTQLPYLQGLTLAHPVTSENEFELSLLIGANHYWDVIEDHIIRGNGPTAMKSKLGYTNEYDLQRFWTIEASGTSPSCNTDNEPIQSYIDSCISRNDDGSYTARFPWKETHPPSPNNRSICEKRTCSLVNKSVQTPKLLHVYDSILNEQEQRGFIEQVPIPTFTKNCHYIPHHAVRKDSTTMSIRIVYDSSCHESKDSPSLNDCLEIGPTYLTDMCSVLFRFRGHSFGISTDIEKAFLHVQLHPMTGTSQDSYGCQM
ncbi:uncharacterized protein [Dysidea avara]|uniref:uncharacterized protein n=1 Tax=Dysidea avara TaxID=196820 RepID=UPI00331F5EA3